VNLQEEDNCGTPFTEEDCNNRRRALLQELTELRSHYTGTLAWDW